MLAVIFALFQFIGRRTRVIPNNAKSDRWHLTANCPQQAVLPKISYITDISVLHPKILLGAIIHKE
jgi:hypothetical protein